MEKITPNQIRTGNLFLYDMGIDHEGPRWEPTALDWQDIKWCDEKNMDFCSVHKGIELTPEWLIKFGFQKDGDSYRLPIPNGHGVDLCIEVAEDDEGAIETPPYNTVLLRQHTCDGVITTGFDYCYIHQVRYVHSLQNLIYALTGSESVLSAGEKV